ncbi:MAG: hypothetical protein N2506_03570, partial [Dehalococcoidales bacterium]|nr:hypothetical protein [Dehalococcoidales bacterium]
MEIKAVTANLLDCRVDAIIIGHFEGAKTPEGEAASVDRALGGAISRLVEKGDIKGKAGEVTILHSLGKLPAERIAVVGLGKRNELDANKVRAATAEVCRYLRNRGAVGLASALLGAGVIPSAIAAQAMT